jgi:predicted Zn-dependent protease
MYLRPQNPLAITNLQEGLKRFPNDAMLSAQLAKTFVALGQFDDAKKQISDLKKREPNNVDMQIAEADLFINRAEPASAKKILIELAKKYPWRSDVMTTLAKIHLVQKENDLGYQVIYNALEYNDANSEIWYLFALLSREIGQMKDAGYGALKASETALFPAERKKIETEFASELAEIRNTI